MQSRSRVHHLRTYNGRHEVDLVVDIDDRCVLAIEVTLSPEVTDNDVKHLRWLREQIGDDLLDAVVITTGQQPYHRRLFGESCG